MQFQQTVNALANIRFQVWDGQQIVHNFANLEQALNFVDPHSSMHDGVYGSNFLFICDYFVCMGYSVKLIHS